MLLEVDNWPYNFTESRDFPSVDQRGTVAGQLLVSDQYVPSLATCTFFFFF
jgi:rhamnogalacturonan endolyase